MSIKDEMGAKEHFRKAVWQTPYLGLRALLGLEFRFAARRSSRR